jgi:hypothetical protein
MIILQEDIDGNTAKYYGNDNPFKTVEKQPAVPRICQWFIDINNEISTKESSNGI